MSTIYDILVKAADGTDKRMEVYKGKVLLIVNVASRCGFTPQYKELQAVHENYASQGLTVLGFPSNDFGAQEPGTMEEIQHFCQVNYGVTFEVLNKVHAIGEAKHPLYAWLTDHAEQQGEVKWNFEKFLISREGELIARYPSKVKPDDAALVAEIEKAL